MSNTYYKYGKSQYTAGKYGPGRTTNMELSLTAYVGGSPNTLQLTLLTQEDNTRFDTAYITLTQQEQDDLICGILERRGVDPEVVAVTLKKLSEYHTEGPGISATGNEQSLVHPAEPPSTE